MSRRNSSQLKRLSHHFSPSQAEALTPVQLPEAGTVQEDPKTPIPPLSPTTTAPDENGSSSRPSPQASLVPSRSHTPSKTPSKTPFEEVPFRNVDYKAMTLDDLIQRSARRVRIGENGEEIHDTTWLEVKLKINSRVNSARKSLVSEQGKEPNSAERIPETERQENPTSDLQGQFDAVAEKDELMEIPPPATPEKAKSPSVKDEKSVQTDSSKKYASPLPSAPDSAPRRSARLAQKRAGLTPASPQAKSSLKRKRSKSQLGSQKRLKQGTINFH